MSIGATRAEIARKVRSQLGSDASDEMVDLVITRVRELLKGERPTTQTQIPVIPRGEEENSDRVIISVFGLNRPGIVAAVTAILAEHSCNILDISQKLMQEFFTMILVVDISTGESSFAHLQDEFTALGERLGIKVYAQHEDVFRTINRL
ncbi:ACT domain-containing protein [Candidatus Neomarinimicrobiota bacterium]